MTPFIPVLGLGALLWYVYKQHSSNGLVAPATPVVPPAPAPSALPPAPAPSGYGVIPAPPITYPGFVGLSPSTQTLSVGQVVNAIWANSAAGAQPYTGVQAADDAIGAQQASVVGTVQGSNQSGVIVAISAVTNMYHIPLPSTLATGGTVTAPTTVWVPAQ